MKIINTEKFVIKSWCENPEEGALAQARNLANLPFLFKQVCLMPDTHQGYGMPIGGVIACNGVVIPNAVGVDIGCGVSLIKTNLTEIDRETLKKVMGDIRATVPTGFSHHKTAPMTVEQLTYYLNEEGKITIADLPIFMRELQSATGQVGTLGGGNHFIEIQKGSDGFIYAMLHSGSRNVGKQVADYYNQIAVQINQKYFSSVPKEQQLAFLPMNTEEGKLYVKEMDACLAFAKLNRRLMSVKIADALVKYTDCAIEDRIDIHHNYATMENHSGKNVMVHRKGATSAKEGEIGLIPGSQGTHSYIVRGKGNPESFMSCSHGAGRRMGRKEAQRTLNLQDEIAKMEAKGIIHGIRSAKDLDESAGSYKDIDLVMEEQSDLVEILVKLEPLAVIKGD